MVLLVRSALFASIYLIYFASLKTENTLLRIFSLLRKSSKFKMLYPLISSYLIRNCMAIIREFDEGLNKLTEQESENLVFKRRVISKCTLYRVFHMSYVSCNNTKLNTLHSNQLRIFCTKYTESCRFNMIIKPVLSKPGKLKGSLEHSAQKSV